MSARDGILYPAVLQNNVEDRYYRQQILEFAEQYIQPSRFKELADCCCTELSGWRAGSNCSLYAPLVIDGESYQVGVTLPKMGVLRVTFYDENGDVAADYEVNPHASSELARVVDMIFYPNGLKHSHLKLNAVEAVIRELYRD